MKKFFIVIICLGSCISMDAQNSLKYGFEFQAYPTGLIIGLTSDYVLSNKLLGHARFGVNLINHRDLGEHDSEKGWGYGGTLGLRYYFDDLYGFWFIEGRSDLWFNKITWQDRIGAINQTTGTTNVTVLQPTVVGGYTFEFGRFYLSPTIGFGYEFNIKTKGSEVGQGPILLLGFMVNI